VFFDPARGAAMAERRKRGGHLISSTASLRRNWRRFSPTICGSRSPVMPIAWGRPAGGRTQGHQARAGLARRGQSRVRAVAQDLHDALQAAARIIRDPPDRTHPDTIRRPCPGPSGNIVRPTEGHIDISSASQNGRRDAQACPIERSVCTASAARPMRGAGRARRGGEVTMNIRTMAWAPRGPSVSCSPCAMGWAQRARRRRGAAGRAARRNRTGAPSC